MGADGKALLCNTVLASQWTMKKASSHHFVQNKDFKVEIVSMAATPLCLHVVPFSLINESSVLDKVHHSRRTVLEELARDRKCWGTQLARMAIQKLK